MGLPRLVLLLVPKESFYINQFDFWNLEMGVIRHLKSVGWFSENGYCPTGTRVGKVSILLSDHLAIKTERKQNFLSKGKRCKQIIHETIVSSVEHWYTLFSWIDC